MRRTHEELMQKALLNPGVKKAYDEMENEFALLKELLKARMKANKTQEDIAKAMDTSTSVIGRLETSGGKHKHSPTLATLQKYALAVGCILQLKLIPKKPRQQRG